MKGKMMDTPIHDDMQNGKKVEQMRTVPESAITPNDVITDPDLRRKLGIVAYVALLLVGAAALFLQFFPELTIGNDLPMRAVLFTTTLITWLAGAFGLSVTTPNVPKVK